LFILGLFRNCVDRITNMRNFIAKIAPQPLQTKSSGKSDHEESSSSSAFYSSTTKQSTTSSKRVTTIDLLDDEEEEKEDDFEVITRNGTGDSVAATGTCLGSVSLPTACTGASSKTITSTRGGWSCARCTFYHASAESQRFLQCEVCGQTRSTHR
jgi:hypothetical protein